MRQITAEQVKKDNSNIRKYDDKLWRVLRKERFKPARPDIFVNEMAAEQQAIRDDAHTDFRSDVDKFIDLNLNSREASILRLYLFGGKIRQTDIGDILNISQSTVTNTLMGTKNKHGEYVNKGVLRLLAEYYYPDVDFDEVTQQRRHTSGK